MKVLFVGLGGIGQRHLRNFRRVLGDSLEPLAYRVRGASPTLTDALEVEPGVDVMQKYGVRAHSDLSAALDESPELVVVSNPSSLHVETAMAAVDCGLNVFVEKPLAHTAQGVMPLVEHAERKRIVGAVGYQLRFHPCLGRAKTIIADGLLGRVIAVRAQVGEYLPGWHKYEDYRLMYAARKDLGGGVILSQIHELDYLYWFFGMPSRIFTSGGHLSDLEIDVEDVASSVMQFEYAGKPLPVHLHQDYVQRPPARTCEVIGTRGKMVVNLVGVRVERYDEQGDLVETFEPPGFQRNDLFLAQTTHMVRCVRREEQPCVTLRDGARSVLLALAARASMETGMSLDVGHFARTNGFGGL
jgi:predicted dehydrogenase